MDGGAALRLPAGVREPDITGLTADSRAVLRGFVFAALPGAKVDGKRFIGDALARGAAALLLDDATGVDAAVPIVTDRNPRQRFAKMAAAFYAPQPKTIAAVTGRRR
jgi:UDP-N-acetylmuramoyl-L-alanyl-D-glutamate--2,6-diaminopimelate ligase